MRNASALAYTEQEAPRHQPVHLGGGEEVHKTGGGRYAGDIGEGLPGRCGTAGDSHLLQVLGTGYNSRGQKLAGSGGQLC